MGHGLVLNDCGRERNCFGPRVWIIYQHGDPVRRLECHVWPPSSLFRSPASSWQMWESCFDTHRFECLATGQPFIPSSAPLLVLVQLSVPWLIVFPFSFLFFTPFTLLLSYLFGKVCFKLASDPEFCQNGAKLSIRKEKNPPSLCLSALCPRLELIPWPHCVDRGSFVVVRCQSSRRCRTPNTFSPHR